MNVTTHPENFARHKIYLQMIAAIRVFLTERKYQEVDLPVMSPALIPESYLEVFETEYNYFSESQKLYFVPSEELFLKRLIAHGFGDVFNISKVFRNAERPSDRHSGEFTMLEYYKTGTDDMSMADELLELLRSAAERCFGRSFIEYRGKKITFEKWEKLSVDAAFADIAGIPEESLFDHGKFIYSAEKKGYNVKNASYEDLFSQIYTHEIEPRMGVQGMPTLLYDYPREFAATARLNADGKTAARFDVYIEGLELGNCYSELADAEEAQIRFSDEAQRRKTSGKITYPTDMGFIEALRKGLGNCSGVALGIDRLGMLFTNATDINATKVINIY